MAKPAIRIFTEDIDFKLSAQAKVKSWLKAVIQEESHRLGELSFIFCSDEYLLGINQQYLNHDTYTDIITFDNSEEQGLISGDIFISIDRVRDNASQFGVTEKDETHRVMVHGTLHLLGYPDKGAAAKKKMTAKEDQYLQIREF